MQNGELYSSFQFYFRFLSLITLISSYLMFVVYHLLFVIILFVIILFVIILFVIILFVIILFVIILFWQFSSV